uniref:NADH-plastoquinone oxidoreductase subunit 5 n=1 Tax=Ceratopteris pteridoides TaxID=58167 RepID=UPI0021B542B0|nr:NADH-plastoquinone oxidoreductase subunit 5 [Ceratopteris pteridoides]UWI72089.1 NADH-plastoquinone oxidoreductase subunit 5 [Ceratopteris pteridoides]
MSVKISNEYAFLIPTCPLVAACLTGLLTFFFSKATRSFRRLCSSFNIFLLIVALFVSIFLLREQFVNYSTEETFLNKEFIWTWIYDKTFCLTVGFLVDSLSLTMAILVTTVGILVMIYSDSYMRYDQGYVRFYAYLSLFTASMSGSVFSPNLIQLYFFWELVGMCSYLLIGFWFTRSSAANACQKAFVTNRIGDFGLLLGILGLYWTTGSFEIFELCDRFIELEKTGFVNFLFANIIIVLLFLGPVAKSAQFPLHVWLPDAMEGPTPISALIHAATMVAAGIFFIARIFKLILSLPLAMSIISWVGGLTALLGATLALFQKDLKKGLAYSTMSQLGYMVSALGIGADRSALFHLITHAYSKALLFLGAGSVIHSLEKIVGYSPNKSQNMFFMGGLRRYMPITGTTFLLGTLSLCGIPPLACFWSKDEIITKLWLSSSYLGLVASGTAALTAFYMFRIHLLTFEGDFRASQSDEIDFNYSPQTNKTITFSFWGKTELMKEPAIGQISQNAASLEFRVKNVLSTYFVDPNQSSQIDSSRVLLKPKESDFFMTIPLIVLAIPTVCIGVLGVDIPETQKELGFTSFFNWFVFSSNIFKEYKITEILFEILLDSIGSFSLSLFGVFLAYITYGQSSNTIKQKQIFKSEFSSEKKIISVLGYFAYYAQSWSLNRGFIDYYYDLFFIRGTMFLSQVFLNFDRHIIDGFVNATGLVSFFSGESIRYGENGRISYYSFTILVGISLLIILLLILVPPFP